MYYISFCRMMCLLSLLMVGIQTMGMTKKEQQTILFYNDHAKEWAERHGAGSKPSFWLSELHLFQEFLPQGNILEIGFGGAGDAAEFIQKGYAYTGIDPAGTLVEMAQKRFPDASFIKSSVYDIKLPAHSFDGFWCARVLLHVPKENIDVALQKIKATLKPDALGFISLVEGEGEFLDEQTGRYFYLYGHDEFSAILNRNGFIIEKQNKRAHDVQRPWLRTWLTYFVRNR